MTQASTPSTTPDLIQNSRFRGVQLGLTSRGLIVSIFLVLLLGGPVFYKADIVAAILTWCTLLALLGLLLITFFVGLHLKSKLRVSIGLPQSNDSKDQIVSKTPVRVFFSLSQHLLPIFFCLDFQAIFRKSFLVSAKHVLSGRIGSDRIIYEDLIFPHRGEWPLEALHFNFGDRLGLTKVTWEIYSSDALGLCVIGPGERRDQDLPLISSCHRPGDILSDASERHGDYFDLKQYHPSDGAKRILWKVFARSGELISRHPERAMTPEGQVVIFVLASAQEDHVCASALTYMHKLEELDLDLFVSCAGANGREIARGTERARDLLIGSVWDTKTADLQASTKDLAHLLSETANLLPGAKLERVVLFCSSECFLNREKLGVLVACCEMLEQALIKPVLILNEQADSYSQAARDQAWSGYLASLLLERTEHAPNLDKELRQEMLQICARRNWESIITT